MNRKLLLPVRVSLRIIIIELKLARMAAELALDVTRAMAERAPGMSGDGDRGPSTTAPPEPEPSAPAPDPAEPARAARRRSATQRTRAASPPAATDVDGGGDAEPLDEPDDRPTPHRPPAAAAPTPPADTEPPPKPRARRAARKATADKPARERASGPTKGEVAAMREAEREAEGQEPAATVGPVRGAGPEIHVAAPWEGYDEMALDAVLERLADADETTLAAVRLYESTHENRQAVLLATETP